MIISAAGIIVFALMAHAMLLAGQSERRCQAIAEASHRIVAAIKDNPALVANAEATDRLASRLMEYIEKEYYSVK